MDLRLNGITGIIRLSFDLDTLEELRKVAGLARLAAVWNLAPPSAAQTKPPPTSRNIVLSRNMMTAICRKASDAIIKGATQYAPSPQS